MAHTRPPTPAPPRRRGLRIAVVVWAVLVVALIALAVTQAVGYFSEPEDQHVPLAGGVVTIEKPGEYSIYSETNHASSAELTGMTGPDGAPVQVDRPGMNETYTLNDRAGVKLGTFTAPAPGEYRLTGTSETITRADELVVGTRTVGAILGTVFTGVAAGLLLVVGGVALLLVFLHRRRQAARPVGPWTGGPAPAGWPQPGGQYPGAPRPGAHDGPRDR